MLRDTIIRAWKDPEYRLNLSAEEQALLPENPAGAIELTDDELDMAVGGNSQSYQSSYSNSYSNSKKSSYKSKGRHRQSYSNRSYKSKRRKHG